MNSYRIITQQDDPNAFPKGAKFAVYHPEQGTVEFFTTRKAAALWIAEQVAFEQSL